MNRTATRYVVVTPVRDEQDYLPLTIESMVRQTIRPIEWVIVNDGSSDRTGEIIEDYSRRYPWIRPFHRKNRGFRKVGGGIIEAFYDGFHALQCADWEFMSKLDGDLSFKPEYFENIFERFAANPLLGIGGGTLYHLENGLKQIETAPIFHVRGGAKVYRRACWDAIGGLWVGLGSDTVDEVKAGMLGWTTMSFRELEMQHHRFTGAAYGRWGALVKDGRADYVSGYHPLFLFAKCVRRLARYPYVLGSVAHAWGYVSSSWRRMQQVDDPALIRYIRRQQLLRLAGRPSIWQ
ncbi:MAG TPA: glycosyltransferase family A protein [Bryobacteraceae bacterium]|nr:glycosyltransferase family A protein [Bryobacteraceae bacterium]